MVGPTNEEIIRHICVYYDDPEAAFSIIMGQLQESNPRVANHRGKIRSHFVNKEKRLFRDRGEKKEPASRLSERIK